MRLCHLKSTECTNGLKVVSPVSWLVLILLFLVADLPETDKNKHKKLAIVKTDIKLQNPDLFAF